MRATVGKQNQQRPYEIELLLYTQRPSMEQGIGFHPRRKVIRSATVKKDIADVQCGSTRSLPGELHLLWGKYRRGSQHNHHEG
jgi:hypothetical protein